jgi:hypothetical protein
MSRVIVFFAALLLGCTRPPPPNLSVAFGETWSRLTVAGVPVDLVEDCALSVEHAPQLFVEFFEYGDPRPEPGGLIYADGEVVAVVLLDTLELKCVADAPSRARGRAPESGTWLAGREEAPRPPGADR